MRIRKLEELERAIAVGDTLEITAIDLDGKEAAAAVDILSRLSGEDLPQLESLMLVDSDIARLPESIGRFTSLEKLVVWDNALDSLPDSMTELHQLSYLSMNGNRFTSLPASVGRLPHLVDIDLHRNPLKRLATTDFAAVDKLDVRACGLPILDEDLAHLPTLRVLSASDNQIAAIGDAIGALGKLEHLRLARNKLRDLPAALSRTSVRNLELWGNPLDTFPAVLLELVDLRRLDLGNCGLHDVPEGLGRLTRLDHLDLSDNPLETLSAAITALQALTWLNLDDTPIAARLGDPEPDEVADTFAALASLPN